MTHFETALRRTFRLEGDYVNDSRDSGGATRFGITEATARAYGYSGDMRDLPIEKAIAILKEGWWDMMRCDEIAQLSPGIAEEVFDTGVNCGQQRAGDFLQTALNGLNRNGTDYPDVAVDGLIGRKTLYALERYLARRGAEGETVMMRSLNSLQGAFYFGLALSRPKDEAFVYGWMLNRVVV